MTNITISAQVFEDMADRIEELEAALPEQIEWVKRLADDLIAAEGREARLKENLAKANANHEHFEREWYLANDRIEELEEHLCLTEEKLEKAVKEKLDAISTLDAWFDRRKLAHNAVDQAVVDAASGYLRTSRVGGMPQEESDIILGVIQDMAHLSVFADLFARTTLAELTGGKDE